MALTFSGTSCLFQLVGINFRNRSILTSSVCFGINIFILYIIKFYVQFDNTINCSYITAWRLLRLQLEDRPAIRRVAADIFNMYSRTVEKARSLSLDLKEFYKTPHHQFLPFYEKL